MVLKLYIDVHVPAAITESFAQHHIDVLTGQDDGTREAEDAALLQRATDSRRLLFSQDQDLLWMHSAKRCA